MGLNIIKAVTRAVGLPDKSGATIVSAVFPPLLATQLAIKATESVASKVLSRPAVAQQAISPQEFTIQLPPNVPAPQPVYFGGGYSSYGALPSGSYLGGGYDQWDYSTFSMISPAETYYRPGLAYSPAPLQQAGGIPWEDLLTLGATFLL